MKIPIPLCYIPLTKSHSVLDSFSIIIFILMHTDTWCKATNWPGAQGFNQEESGGHPLIWILEGLHYSGLRLVNFSKFSNNKLQSVDNMYTCSTIIPTIIPTGRQQVYLFNDHSNSIFFIISHDVILKCEMLQLDWYVKCFYW